MKIISLTHGENRLPIYHREGGLARHVQLARSHKHLSSWELSWIFPPRKGKDSFMVCPEDVQFHMTNCSAFSEQSKLQQDYSTALVTVLWRKALALMHWWLDMNHTIMCAWSTAQAPARTTASYSSLFQTLPSWVEFLLSHSISAPLA